MKKVMFICDWGETPEQLLTRYGKQTPDGLYIWKNEIQGTSNHEEADYFIVLDGIGSVNFKVPNDKVIFMKREPDYIKRANGLNYKHVRKYTDGPTGITWWINKPYNELKELKYPEKTKKCSLITGYKYPNRKVFLDRLFSNETGCIDLYGRGIPRKFKDYKGMINTPKNCKLSGILPYEYSIALMNSQQYNCFSEKICDSYLGWSMPIYWGCSNIGDFFPEDSYKLIDLSSPNIREQIIDIVNTPLTDKNITAIAKARELVLDKYNIWEIVREVISKL